MDKKMFAIIGKSISILHYQKQKNVAAMMGAYGLRSPSYGFLSYLKDREGITQRELCSILFINEAVATRTMGTLEKKGFIVRKRSETDARSYELYLTNKAKAVIPKLLKSYEEWWEQMSKKLSLKKMEILCSCLKEMAEQATGQDLFSPEAEV
ncbi:MAG: MarR family transcriptional regulator [Treponema sp.]|nr:MarR family transcriptional regulator [Treponema sp.]